MNSTEEKILLIRDLGQKLNSQMESLQQLNYSIQRDASSSIEQETFDAARLVRLESALGEAIREGVLAFEFEGLELWVDYARRVCEYLRNQFSTSGGPIKRGQGDPLQ